MTQSANLQASRSSIQSNSNSSEKVVTFFLVSGAILSFDFALTTYKLQ